jgi:ABC-2 type transport system permease protein
MKKPDIRKSFQHKKFKYGGYATLLTMIVLAIVIALNLVVGQLDLKLDLTKNKLFSLSEQTTNILKDLKSDVNITVLSQAGKENQAIREMIVKYTDKSKRIKLDYVDPLQHPEFANKYTKNGESLSENSVIVESGNKYKVINAYDLYNFSQDGTSAESLAVEQRVTGAIMYVTSEKNPVVYTLQGHNESAIPASVAKSLENENYITEEFTLVGTDWKPEKEDILLISSPKRDISSEELTKIKDFLGKGGKALIFVDLIQTELPNMAQLLNYYGVNVKNALVYEGNVSNTIANQKIYLLPNMKNHTILNPLLSSKLPVLTYAAQPIEELKVKRDTITIEPLLTTSDEAYAKTDLANLQTKSQEKEQGDLTGPFNLAITITDKLDYNDVTKNPRIILFTSSAVMNEEFISSTNGGNLDMIMNSLNWLVDRKENVSIRPKSLSAEILNINAYQQLTVAGISVVVIPVIIAVAGVTVWLRRRHL